MNRVKNYSAKIICIVVTVMIFSAVIGCARETVGADEKIPRIEASTEQKESEAPSENILTVGEFSSEESTESFENESEEKIPYGILFDTVNRKILFSANADEKIYPASIVKILTACTALKYVPADTVFTVGTEQEFVNSDSSLCLIQSGQKLTLYDLICGMLLASGNDAAYTVAVNTARLVYKNQALSDEQAVEAFCRLMNDLAAHIGMKDSRFANPDGRDDEGQYTTVNDLLKLTIYASANDTVSSIAACEEKHVVFASGQNITWENTNKLLDKNSEYYLPYATGMKTGSTENAGKCLIATANKRGKKYIAVVMGCETEEQRYSSALRLLNKAFG